MIVFPMAGASRRFAEAGYRGPKYLLPLAGRTVLERVLAGFADQFDTRPFLFVSRRDLDPGDAARALVASTGIRSAHFVALERPTSGQAETVRIGIDRLGLPDDEDLTIFNIDTIRTAPDGMGSCPGCDGWLEVFAGRGRDWSFVRPAYPGTDRVAEVAEKTKISDLCSSGLYHFARCGDFRAALDAERRTGPSQAGEYYVAPLYNRLLDWGADIRFRRIGRRHLAFCGVPKDYEALCAGGGHGLAHPHP